MSRLIAYGDIHGCYDEFVALREQIAPAEDDIEICVGDFLTKGVDSLGVLRFLQISPKIKSNVFGQISTKGKKVLFCMDISDF